MSNLISSRIMPRTTLDLDVSVLRALRRRGSLERKSMGQVASELLARTLAEPADSQADEPLHWISSDLGQPRVDLEDKEAVRAILDERS
jgi:hypothetical protein